MEFLTELWLPIVLSAVFVFVVSSVIHMALPYHKKDFRKMSNEDTVLDSIRTAGVEIGSYMFPCAESMQEWKTEAMAEKLKRGPVGWLTVVGPGGFNMGRSLGLWFLYTLFIGAIVGYIGWNALPAGAHYLGVFQITGAAAVLGYAVGYFHDSIWKGGSWSTTAKFVFDGVVYALVTAGTFGWLWPELG